MNLLKPAIKDVELDPLRGDEENTGGIIYQAMFARLLAESVVADLTLANPNVFYELGIRHAAKPYATVPIYANIHLLPFDVTLMQHLAYFSQVASNIHQPWHLFRLLRD